MAAQTVNYQCPSCNGPLHFDGASQQLVCDYCESSFDPSYVEQYYAQKQEQSETSEAKEQAREEKLRAEHPEEAAPVPTPVASTGDPIKDFLKRAPWNELDEGVCAYNCSSCGAQLITDGTTAVTECPYCGNPSVLPGTLSGSLKPDFVIPFKKSREEALAALKAHYGSVKFLPDAFTEGSHLEHIQGVYVPFWLYDSQATFDASYQCTNSHVATTGKTTVTTTDHYNVGRSGVISFEGVPVDGSTKMPDALMDAIEPFDYSELKPFNMGYLPGYVTERYDLDASDCAEREERRVQGSIPSLVQQTVSGYESVESTGMSVNNQVTRVLYALMPVWMLHTKWNGDDYLFAMNGQTGRLIGDLPVDKSKVNKYFAIRFAGILVAALAVCAAVFFL